MRPRQLDRVWSKNSSEVREVGLCRCAGADVGVVRHVLKADWRSPADVKREFGSASGRVVVNIAGNKYRIVVWINYPYRVVYIRFIGTHAQYDKIDAQTI